MGLLPHTEFLAQLQLLFRARQAHGSVFLTQKRLTYEPPTPSEDVPMPSASHDRQWSTLIRATDGQSNSDSKTKISTVVQPSDYPAFSLAYGSLLKASITSLRKKRKLKRKPLPSSSSAAAATPSTPSAQHNTATATFVPRLPKVIGPRRGTGAKKRRRAVRRRERELRKLRDRKKRDE